MQRPSFQFYPGDWQSNKNLRRCTHAEKGIWMDVMCLMHDSEEYGILRWPLEEIAMAVRCDESTLLSLKAKGVLKGADTGETCEPYVYIPRSGRQDGAPVTLIEEQVGPLWYSSRFVRDEYLRGVRGDATRFIKKQPAPTESPPEPPTVSPLAPIGESKGAAPIAVKSDGSSSPSSSSSSSSSSHKTMPTGSVGSSEPTTPKQDKQKKERQPKPEPKFGEEARTLAATIYDHLKGHGALPASKDFFVRQALIAEDLLKKHPLQEWQTAFTWALTDSFHAQKMVNLRYLGDVVWPQYAKRHEGDAGPRGTPKAFGSLQAAMQRAMAEEAQRN